MKPKGIAIAGLCLCLLLSITVFSQEKYSKVRIKAPENKFQLSQLIGMLEVDHFLPDEDGSIITEISQSQVQQLKSSGYVYQILIKDVARHLDSVNREYYQAIKDPLKKVAFEQSGGVLNNIIATPSAFEVKPTFGGYYSFAEMEAAMDALVAAYPTIASKTSIGKTYNNRDIWVIKISDNVAMNEANEPELLYMGLQHAREAITGASMIFLMQYLCERYAADARIKDLVDNRVFYIIPCFNPDGWEYNRTSQGGNAGGMWRKNRRLISGSTYGVDLNRNWGVDWANCSAPILGSSTSCGSGSATSDTYWGSAAFSEAETQAVRAFTKSRNIVMGFDQHAYGPYYSLPFGRQSLHPNDMPEKGANFYTAIPARMGKYNGMRAADSYDALGYEVAGGFKDWMLMGELGVDNKDTVWAMTGEGGSGNASNSFWAPASQIVNLCKGMTYQNIQLAYAAGTYVDLQDVSSIAVSSTTGNMQFRIKRIGIGNNPVTVSLIPLENIQSSGAPVTVNSMPYYGEYTGNISYTLPVLSSGSPIRFIWKVETSGYSYSDTVTKFYNPTIVFSDNMEGSLTTNWIVPSGGSASTKWGFTNTYAYSGSQSLAETPAGNYANAENRIITYKNAINLTGKTGAYLSFWVRHRAENFRDKMQVQVSTNGTTWTAVAGKTTIQEPGTIDGSTINGQPSLTGIQDFWVKEVFDLSAYAGLPSLEFRFVFTSDNSSSTFKYRVDDGFYIDDVIFISTTASMVVLPARNIHLEARPSANKSVQLNWTASIDDQHDRFELQRSSNGTDFTMIYSTSDLPPCQYADASPLGGMNYYRVKQSDKDGRSSFSKTVPVSIKDKLNFQVHPNPAHDVLDIQLSNLEKVNAQVIISDMQGKQVYSKKISPDQSGLEIRIDISSWKPQLYLVTVVEDSGQVMVRKKLIKH